MGALRTGHIQARQTRDVKTKEKRKKKKEKRKEKEKMQVSCYKSGSINQFKNPFKSRVRF